jgi:hypothetical protein
MTSSIKSKLGLAFIFAFVLFGAFAGFQIYRAEAVTPPGITAVVSNPNPDYSRAYTFFVATTTTATSTTQANSNDPGFFIIAGMNTVNFFFSRGDATGHGNSGSTIFKVQVSPDGVTWFDYNELGQITNTATADAYFARVGSATISAAT